MRQNKVQTLGLILILVAICVNLTGCKYVKITQERMRDLEYTVLNEEKLPEELKKILDEKKSQPFKMTFQDNGYLYICQGFGEQKTSGYSIQVRDAYETENAIYFLTSLLGPLSSEPNSGVPTYPYIVIKTELIEKAVVFE